MPKGVFTRSPDSRIHLKKVYPDELVGAVRLAYESGLTQKEVAAHLGIGFKVVTTLMNNHEIPRRRANDLPSSREKISQSVKAAWDEGLFDRTHPPDCAHCIAVRRPKPPRTESHNRNNSLAHMKPLEEHLRPHPSVHVRLRKRSPASQHACKSCGEQAREWALKLNVPKKRVHWDEKTRLWFSFDFDDYEPLCSRCHRRQDKSRDDGLTRRAKEDSRA